MKHRPSVGLIVLLLLSFGLVGCAAADSTTPPPDGALMAIQTRGGLCREGTCESTYYVERNGLVHFAAKPPNEVGTVPADQMAALDSAIAATNFAELRSHPFTGTCPTAFDGQEVVFEFATGAGVERIESCQVEVDYNAPLFAAVVNAVGPFVPLPTGIDLPLRPDEPQQPPQPVDPAEPEAPPPDLPVAPGE